MVSTIFSETVVPGSFVLFWEVRCSACRADGYVPLQAVTRNGSLNAFWPLQSIEIGILTAIAIVLIAASSSWQIIRRTF
jgi:hypothetical protein